MNMSGGQTPGQEQEVLVSAIKTSAISHKSADRIYESLLVWLSEEELDHRYGYSRFAVTSLQTRLQGAAILKTMRRETITATGAGIANPTTITTEGDLLNLQETPPATSVTMSAPADPSSQSVQSPTVSTSVWSASRPSLPAGKPAVKLPKLGLPTFSGEYLKFNAFWQAFEISVISQNIPNSSKFAYLNSLLSGDAAHAVSGFAMTDAGFTDACSILKERFGDSNQLFFKHLQELLKLNPRKVLNSRDTECLWDFYNSVQSHVRSLSFLGIDAAKYGIIITPIIISRLPCQLALEWADVSKGKEGDLPHLLTFLQDSLATRQRALCFSTSSAKATSKSSSESTLPERLPTAGGGDGCHLRVVPPGQLHRRPSTPKRFINIVFFSRYNIWV